MGVRVDAHMIGKDAVRSECAIPNFNFSKTFRNCNYVSSPASKNGKPLLKSLLEGGGGVGRGTYDRQSCSEK